jgi:hypothetical protein
MTLFQHIACEFPLLRDRFWPESAIVTASATGGRYCAVSNDGKSSTTQCYASLPHTAGGAGAARRNSTSSCQSSSGRCVSPGSAAAHAARQGSGDVDSLNAPDSQNTAAETRPRGPIGLRSLDLQVTATIKPCAVTYALRVLMPHACNHICCLSPITCTVRHKFLNACW